MKKKPFVIFNKLNFLFLYFSLIAFAFLIILEISIPTRALSAEVTLQWDPSVQATGYNLHYGFESNSYDNVIDVGDNLQYTVSDLNDNQLYYFAVSAYNENGESSFSEEVSYNTEQNTPPILSEIIGTSSSGIRYWEAASSEWTLLTSSTPDGDIAAGDFSGDGKADVASSWNSGLWYQDGATFGWTKVSNSAPYHLTAGDVTGDGRFEIIGTWNSGIWYWDAASSKWTLLTSSTPDGDIAAGDFTGDGKADVASIWDDGLWYQDGATFGWKKVSNSAPYHLTAGDVTGDGRFEIIGTWKNGIWFWDENESIWTQMTSSTPDGNIAAGDFTGDGKADVASIWNSSLWYQDGATFGWKKVSNSAPYSLTAGDVTGK